MAAAVAHAAVKTFASHAAGWVSYPSPDRPKFHC